MNPQPANKKLQRVPALTHPNRHLAFNWKETM
jgi:hypothetical protein